MNAEIQIKILDLPEVQAIIEKANDALFSANVEIDNFRKMLADRDSEILIIRAMNAKRYDALDLLRKMTEDVGLDCWSCKGLREVIDPALFVDGKAEIERIKRLDAVVRWVKICQGREVEAADFIRTLVRLVNEVDPIPLAPIPMCKPDPLGDIMPPARDERGGA